MLDRHQLSAGRCLVCGESVSLSERKFRLGSEVFHAGCTRYQRRHT